MGTVLDRNQTVAPPGYDRWLVPPAALAVHLAIGQGYALSVFNLPLTRILGVGASVPGDWPLSATVWMFNIAFFFLGASAAIFGTWVERAGPRKTMVLSALCFSGGLFLSALAVRLHVIALLYAGYGVLGGVGLGLGYIAPVSTLLKWFPDRPGMATGMAIMGFGGGAMVGAPLAVTLMDRFRHAGSTGVAETFASMGALYLGLMLFGAWVVRVPEAPHVGAATVGLTAREAIRRRDFWLLWVVLFTNVTAGIGILSQASPMIQEMFGVSPHAAAGFVGLLSLFNLAGRFAWSSLSDRIGRKRIYAVYLGLGMAAYAALPSTKRVESLPLFVAAACLILSMYGGGFATIPAYLRDRFGSEQVGAIHGRLLTAWSTAALVGPTVVTYVREYRVGQGVPRSQAYSATMYGLVLLLLVGFSCNALIPRHPAFGARLASGQPSLAAPRGRAAHVRRAIFWTVVLVPLGWGIAETVKKSLALFR